MNILKQSTAATIKFGPLIDDTDGKSAETGLTLAQADVRLSKNGGDFAQKNSTTSATHDENGYYDIPLNATDTGTLGRLRVAVSKSGALPVWQDFLVVTANVYDTLCSTDSLDVNVTALADDVIKAASFDESTAFPLKAADTGSTQVARVGADGDTLETLSDEIAAVKTDTAAILEDTGTTLDGLIKDVPTVAEFNARTKLAADYFDPAADTVANVTAVGTTTNLTNLPTMPADWVTASGLKADAVAEIQAGLALEATLTAIKGAGWTTETLAAIDALIDAIKAKTDNLPASPAPANEYDTELAAIQADLNNPDQYKADVSGIPAAVWGYATRTLSSFGTLISDIWSHATRTLSAFGFTVATQSDANVTAIKAKTDNLPATPANEATLTAIKGAGWTDETLVALMTAIENISAGSGASAQEVWEYATRTLTGLPALPTDWITAASLKADAVTEIQSGLATAAGLSTISGLVDDLESRLTAARAGYLDKLNVAGELANTSNAYAFKADTVSVPQNVWSYHTRLLTNIGSTIESPTAGDPLNIYRDTTVLISLTNLGAIGVDDKLWFTVKDSVEEPDEDSIIQIDRLGLLYINGAPASQAEDGSITVLDDELGNVEIKLAQRQAALLPLYEAYPAQWDIKILHSGIVSILNIGTLYIKGTPTRAIL